MALQLAAPKVDVHSIEDRTIPGPGGELPIRIYRAVPRSAQAHPAALFLHGGGFYLGSLETHDHLCRRLCHSTSIVVVAVDYRLAPEHKFPAAVEDSYAALRWLSDAAATLGVDASRIAIVGDSAGGTLAVVMCLLARERGGPRIACHVSVYPALTITDGEEFRSRRELGGGEYFIALDDFAFFRSLYLDDSAAQARHPLVSPIYAPDYRGLPPALVVTAGYDPCRDEAERYVERLRGDGVPAAYTCFESTIHPFYLFDGVLDAGRAGQQLVADALKEFFATGRMPGA
jgi:acetyl esterase